MWGRYSNSPHLPTSRNQGESTGSSQGLSAGQSNSALRRLLDQWFEAEGVQPLVRGEFADRAVLKVFGSTGMGIFAIPSVVEEEVQPQYRVRQAGRVESIRERFYVISVDRRLKHPVVVAITTAARQKLFV